MNSFISYFVMILLLLSAPVTAQNNNTSGISTASNNAHQTQLAFQVISKQMALNKKMVSSVKLAAFDKYYARLEIILTVEASNRLIKQDKMKPNQKLVITVNDQIISHFMIMKKINEDSLVLSISTSRRNADLIMKLLS